MRSWFVAVALLLAAPVSALAQPQDISAPGTVPHNAAHAGFPEQVGAFRRTHVMRYGENDISGNYDLVRGEDFARASVYIYPAPRVREGERAQVCRDEMAGVTAAMLQTYPGAKADESGAAPVLPGTEPGLGFRSVHHLRMVLRGAGPEETRRETRLYCYVGGDWLVKFFISSTAGFDVADAIETFVRDGAWPGRGPGTIAMRQGPSREPRSLR